MAEDCSVILPRFRAFARYLLEALPGPYNTTAADQRSANFFCLRAFTGASARRTAYKKTGCAKAHPAECCGDIEIRTLDPLLAKQMLYQLSYTPKRVCKYRQIKSKNKINPEMKIKEYEDKGKAE